MNVRAHRCRGLLCLVLLTRPVGAAPALRVTPITCAPEDRLTLRIDNSTPASALLRERLRMDVMVTDAYRGVPLARATMNLRPVTNALEGELRISADPGAYAVQGANRNEAITSRALFFVRGVARVGAWMLPANLPLLGARLPSANADAWGALLETGANNSGGFNTLWLDAAPQMTNALNQEVGGLLHRHGGSCVVSLPAVANRLSAAAGSEGAATDPQATGCLVASSNRAAWARELEALRGRLRNGSEVEAGLLALVFSDTSASVCYCPSCRDGFQDSLAATFGKIENFNTMFGARHQTYSEIELPRDPQAGSPALAKLWEDYQYQILPSFSGWGRERVRSCFSNAAFACAVDMMPPAPSAGAVQYHRGVDLLKLAESVDAVVTSVGADNVAPGVALLAAVAEVKSPSASGYPTAVWARVGSDARGGDNLTLHNVARMEALFRGATGIFHDLRLPPSPAALRQFGDSSRFLAEHASLLLGSKVASDVGVVFPVATERLAREGMGPAVIRDYSAMMQALVTRHWSPRAVWSERSENLSSSETPMLFVPGEGAMSARFVDRLRKYLEGGGRVYLEGLTLYDADGKRVPWLLKDLVGVETETVGGHASELLLDDLWVFGKAREKLPVEQVGVINKLNGARVLAKFADGTPGLVWRRVGLGEVFFTPSRIANSSLGAARYARYCDALAAAGYTSAIHVRGDATNEIHCALLRTKTMRLFGLFNYGAAKTVEVTLDAPQKLAYDLRAHRALGAPDNRARFKTHTLLLPAHDWLVIANADSAEALDKEIRQVRYKLTVK